MNIELQFMKDFFLFSEHFIERTVAMGVKFMKCKINDKQFCILSPKFKE